MKKRKPFSILTGKLPALLSFFLIGPVWPSKSFAASSTLSLESNCLFKCIVAGLCGAIIMGIVMVFVCVVRPRMRKK